MLHAQLQHFIHGKKLKHLLFIVMITSLTVFTVPTCAVDAESLRGKRYCEVIISKGRVFEVYNTLSLNDCPDAEWKRLTVQNIKKETGSFYVFLNGPRRFILDSAKNSSFIDNTPRKFQNLDMRKAGILHLSLRETLFGSKPFREHHVERKTTWVYEAGKRVYELIDPEGQVYVMQSFALSPRVCHEKDLMNLDTWLKLPKGWQFKTGILKETSDVVAVNENAIVIQDNLRNTYQRATQDLLRK